MYTLDTNPIIYYTDDEPAAVAALEDLFAQAVPLYVSTITELELFSYPAMTDDEAVRIEAFLTAVRIVPVTCGGCTLASERSIAPSRRWPCLRSFAVEISRASGRSWTWQ